MAPRGIAFCAAFVLVLIIVFVVDRLVRHSLRQLLDEVTPYPPPASSTCALSSLSFAALESPLWLARATATSRPILISWNTSGRSRTI